MPVGDWEKANGRSWPHSGNAPVWPDDYPATCNCNPPSHTPEQIEADGSFHSRTCPDHSGMVREAGALFASGSVRGRALAAQLLSARASQLARELAEKWSEEQNSLTAARSAR